MTRRLELQALLKRITPNVYFQAPPTLQMKYPCIRYERSNMITDYADNLPYGIRDRYMLTVIDADPDSTIPGEVAKLPMASFNRHYTADNLNHDVFELYF